MSVDNPGEANAPAAARQPDAAALAPGLYLVATPIGNLRDITLRALDVLASADRLYAEDTRRARTLLDAHGIKRKAEPYHEHNAAAARPKILAQLASGRSVALISDAGTPLVSDPGYKLVRETAASGASVIPVPGPSAVLAGLNVSGLPCDRFLFAGFPPAKPSARARWLAELAGVPATLVLFEAARRLPESLAAMCEALGDRPAAVARELTKTFEETRRDNLGALAAHYAAEGAPKGEVVVVIGPPEDAGAWDDAAVDAALAEALAREPASAAAARVAAASGRPKRAVYARALALKERRG